MEIFAMVCYSISSR